YHGVFRTVPATMEGLDRFGRCAAQSLDRADRAALGKPLTGEEHLAPGFGRAELHPIALAPPGRHDRDFGRAASLAPDWPADRAALGKPLTGEEHLARAFGGAGWHPRAPAPPGRHARDVGRETSCVRAWLADQARKQPQAVFGLGTGDVRQVALVNGLGRAGD